MDLTNREAALLQEPDDAPCRFLIDCRCLGDGIHGLRSKPRPQWIIRGRARAAPSMAQPDGRAMGRGPSAPRGALSVSEGEWRCANLGERCDPRSAKDR